MPQGKTKVKTKVPDSVKQKLKKKKGVAFTRRANAPIQPRKTKLKETQKIKQMLSKAVNKSVEEDIRTRAKEGEINFSKAQNAVAKHNSNFKGKPAEMLGAIKKISLLQCVMVFVAAVAIWRPIWLKDFCKEHIVPHLFAKSLAKTSSGEVLFTIEELSKYTGANGSKGLYIAIMGTVYDVEKGRKHYGPGGTYHFFAGRDATTSFITGEFEQVTSDLDDVLQLAPRDLLSVIQWQEFYNKEYKQVGKLIGRFYDSGGGRTKYFGYVQAKIREAREEQKLSEKVKEEFPACNTEWSVDTGTTFWCTTRSGGKERDWVGVPRKYYEAGRSDYRCACVHPDRLDSANLKEFAGCDATAERCVYKFDEATGSN